MRHQRTDLPPSKSEWKQHSHKHRSKSQKRYSNEHKNQRPPFKKFDPSQAHKRRDICSKCGDSKHVDSFKCPARKFQCKTCKNMVILPACATKSNHPLSQKISRHINCKQEVFTYKKIQYVAIHVIWPQVMNHSAFTLKFNIHKWLSRFPHLIILLPTLPIDWSHITREISTWEPD